MSRQQRLNPGELDETKRIIKHTGMQRSTTAEGIAS